MLHCSQKKHDDEKLNDLYFMSRVRYTLKVSADFLFPEKKKKFSSPKNSWINLEISVLLVK